MARLIDADALREVIMSFQYTPTSNENERCVRAIDAAPTVEKQEPVKPIIENGFSYCGVCGRSLDSDFADEEVFRFCPNCGRKVRQDAAD